MRVVSVPLAGVALYNGVFKAVPLKKMLLAAMLLGVGLGSTQVRPFAGRYISMWCAG